MKTKDAKHWPTELNPCTDEHHNRVRKSALYDVCGRVTKVCSLCVFAAEETHGTRKAYLDTLTPDLSGKPVIA